MRRAGGCSPRGDTRRPWPGWTADASALAREAGGIGGADSLCQKRAPPAQAGVWSVRIGYRRAKTIRPRAGCSGGPGFRRARRDPARILPQAEPREGDLAGHAPGTYTGPQASTSCWWRCPAGILLEGHTSSRNVGGAIDRLDADAQRHRTWVRQQDVEVLRRTGLAEVIARHGAQYLNVTRVGTEPVPTEKSGLRSGVSRYGNRSWPVSCLRR